jgi:hypothetical protein
MSSVFFVLVLVVVLVILATSSTKPRNDYFTTNEGLYNYFYQSYMNPYPLPLNKFYSNDKEKI